MTTLPHHMPDKGIRYGLQTMCEGRGQAKCHHCGVAVTATDSRSAAFVEYRDNVMVITINRPEARMRSMVPSASWLETRWKKRTTTPMCGPW